MEGEEKLFWGIYLVILLGGLYFIFR